MRIILLLLAAIVVGFVIFAISFWLLHIQRDRAIGIGVAGTVGGIAGELFGGYLKNKKAGRRSINK